MSFLVAAVVLTVLALAAGLAVLAAIAAAIEVLPPHGAAATDCADGAGRPGLEASASEASASTHRASAQVNPSGGQPLR